MKFIRSNNFEKVHEHLFDDLCNVLEKLEELRDWEMLDKCIWVCLQETDVYNITRR